MFLLSVIRIVRIRVEYFIDIWFFVKNSFYALVRFNQFDSYVFMILIIYRLLNTENLYEYIKIFILYITSIYYI